MKTKKRIMEKKDFENLLTSVKQAVEIERGKRKSACETFRVIFRPAPKWSKTAIKKLRKEFGMSQPDFASLLNVKVATVRAWEQGQRTPDSAAARLLEVFSWDTDIANKLSA